jgi:Sec-independent protein secretion pathway component TatC
MEEQAMIRVKIGMFPASIPLFPLIIYMMVKAIGPTIKIKRGK